MPASKILVPIGFSEQSIIALGLSLPELEDGIAPAYVGNNRYWEEEQYEI